MGQLLRAHSETLLEAFGALLENGASGNEAHDKYTHLSESQLERLLPTTQSTFLGRWVFFSIIVATHQSLFPKDFYRMPIRPRNIFIRG